MAQPPRLKSTRGRSDRPTTSGTAANGGSDRGLWRSTTAGSERRGDVDLGSARAQTSATPRDPTPETRAIMFKRNDGSTKHPERRPAAAPAARSMFDFGDGPVRAERHRNPDGSLGGWVAQTAHADDEA